MRKTEDWRIHISFEQFQKISWYFLKWLIEQRVADLLVDDNFAYSSSLVVEHNPCHPARNVQQLTLKATAATSAESKRTSFFPV